MGFEKLLDSFLENDQGFLAMALIEGSIKSKFQSRIIFRFYEEIDSSLLQYSRHIFMYKKPILLDNGNLDLIVDQPDEYLRNSSRDDLISSGIKTEKIKFLSLEDRLNLINSYHVRGVY